MPRAIVVVPCYNEARRLPVLAFEQYARSPQGTELLLVNDGSRDETLELIERLHRAHPRRVSFLHLAVNGGKAEAVRQGVLLALRSGADYIGFWDADLATPLEDIDSFCRVLNGKPQVELVVGTRIGLLGRRIERRPLRRWLGRVFANTASLALGVKVFDTQCGAKLFRVTPALAAYFDRPFRTRWIFDVEIMARMRRTLRGTSRRLADAIYEHPLDQWRDVAGSRVKGGDFVRAIFELASIWWAYLRPGAPPLPSPAPPSQTAAPKRAA